VKPRVGQHFFTKERDYHGKGMWRCEDRTCGARIHAVDGEIVKWQNPILLSLGRQVKILAAMEELASSTAELIAHIINTFYARVEVRWAHLISTVDVSGVLSPIINAL